MRVDSSIIRLNVADDIKAYLAKKAEQLDLGRGEVLNNIQKLIDRNYPGQARAKSLHNGVLKITTSSAPLASELRLRQVELVKQAQNLTAGRYPIERLLIQIQSD